MSEQTEYQVTGFSHGRFDGQDGRKVNYANLFVISPLTGEENDDYHYAGYKAEKFRCASADILKDVKPHAKVNLYFDKNARVVMIVDTNSK